ncbi:hypothetical protein KQ51_01364 [Candidatus Izimaplasma bacterium HR1]|jgi:M3 family oligoendopeptidase|uniref:M3 family oligoendopeptidase n=1 Tax=Candidatus Izimoplasma sp. HR1 TaxID=1541959 RepID=UPI0004F87D7F|nr:hypothetical protein KQ51_01364 [Candidatus Izimaplasma bacterium HR1]
MLIKELKYESINLDKYIDDMEYNLSFLANNNDFETELNAINEIVKIKAKTDTAIGLAVLRHYSDTSDEFYSEVMKSLDTIGFEIDKYETIFAKKLLDSKHQEEITNLFGEYYLQKAQIAQRTSSEEVKELLIEESRLVQERTILMSKSQVEFRGKTYTITQMPQFTTSVDRETRKAVRLAMSSFFENQEEHLDELFDKLVNVRTKIAHKLGYDNFLGLGYDRLNRIDYSPSDLKKYYKLMVKHFVPLNEKLVDKKKKRLGIEDFKYFDEAINFVDGNPTLKGNAEWIKQQAMKMYSEMSKETEEFFDYMMSYDLMDFESRDNKVDFGFYMYFDIYKSPFVFGSFNGTSGDVKIITHETGHAFQAFIANRISNLYYPLQRCTPDIMEIHSMSMELLTMPWMELFFQEDADKYRSSHLESSIGALLRITLYDEFLHIVYEKPELSKDERKLLYKKLEEKYFPSLDYDTNEFLKKGTNWYRIDLLFSVPFYMIDYNISQMVAYQIYAISRKDHNKALSKYFDLCKMGGKFSLSELLRKAELNSPFDNETLIKIVEEVSNQIDKLEDIINM